MAAQLTAMNRDGPARSGPHSKIARAISSLPVPLSPVISTVERVGATLRATANTCCIAGLAPTIWPGS